MSWDAYAVRPEIDPRANGQQFLSAADEDAFRRANAVPWLDGLCRGLLHRATGVPDYDESNEERNMVWSPETVRTAHALAQWAVPLAAYQGPEHLDRARLFLDVCAALNLAIWFTW
jgi:hypothetical protein